MKVDDVFSFGRMVHANTCATKQVFLEQTGQSDTSEPCPRMLEKRPSGEILKLIRGHCAYDFVTVSSRLSKVLVIENQAAS